MAPRNPQLSLYLPRTLLAWQADDPSIRSRSEEGTVVFVDISGFTPLVERATAGGRAGAEEISAVINQIFEEMLAVALDEGGDVLKFGGDASLLLFSGDGHLIRAARAALDIHDAIAEAPPLRDGEADIGVSIGLEVGELSMVIGGEAHKEMLVFGPAIDGALQAEKVADTGDVVAGPAARAALPAACLDGELVIDAPDDDTMPPLVVPGSGDDLDLADYVPVRLRDHLSVAGSDGEHRQAAIGFVQLPIPIGNPDERDEVLARFTELLIEQAERHEVTMLASDADIGAIKFMLCAGVPSASTNEEERLLRTFRRVAEGAESVGVDPERGPRMGVTRGVVFGGDFGAVSRRYYTLLGDSVNLAARLMSVAEPGSILTLDQVLERSPTRFAIERFEPLLLKGKSKSVGPISVGPVIGIERIDWARFLPLIGRADEFGVLLSAFNELRGGVGGVVEVVGEAGVGKTRLVSELLDRATLVDTYQLVCEHYEIATPHFVAAHLIRGVLALKPDSDPGEVLARLGDIRDRHPDLAPWLPLLSIPLAVSIDETDETAALDPEFRTARLHQLTEDLIAALRPDPMMIVVEDSHWLDEASRSIIDHLSEATERRPWLIVETFRPDGGREVETDRSRPVTLDPLSDVDAMELVRVAARETPVSDQRIGDIVERSGGHPYFALELLRHEGSDGLPESVEGVVAQRIDRLESRDRQLLRYVAVLGNSFPLDLLAEALPQVAPSAEDNDTWQRLSEFLDVTVFGTVQFKQDLIRLVAYEGLTFRRRREVHGIVAEAIERRARRRARRQAPLLARHNSLAGRWDKAWEFATIAGAQASANGASADAARLYSLALEASEHLVQLDVSAVADVHESLGDAALLAGQLERAEASFNAALAIDTDATAEQRARRHGRVATARRERGDLDGARSQVEAGLSCLADEPSIERVELLGLQAGLLHRSGDYVGSNQAAALAMAEARTIGAQAGLGAAALLTITNDAALGRNEPNSIGAEAIAIFDELGDALNRGKVRNNIGYRHYFRGEWDEAVDAWRAAQADYRTAGDVIGSATADNNLAEILSDQGHLDQAEERFSEALRAWRAAGFSLGVALATQNLGRVQARRGAVRDAQILLGDALQAFEKAGSQAYVLDTRLRLAEAEGYGGSLIGLRTALEELGELSDQPTLRSARCRLEALVASAKGDADGVDAALVAAVDAAGDAPYERALSLRLRGELLGDDPAAAEAAEILQQMGATAAAGYRIPQ